MSKAGNQNIPGPDEKPSSAADNIPRESSEQSLHDLFLQDISSVKHISRSKHDGMPAERISLIEAIFNATIIRSISATVNEFRLLGASFINKPTFSGLANEVDQSQYLSALKGEIKDSPDADHRLNWQKILQLQREKELKEKGLSTLKGKAAKGKINKNIIWGIFKTEIATDKKLSDDSSFLDKEKPERIPSQDTDMYSSNKRYNVSETIRKATELELSMPSSADHQKSLFPKLEQSQAVEFGAAVAATQQATLSVDRLRCCIEQFSNGKILVLGDLLIDELLEGRPERISREAPVLILEHIETVLIPGGAANAAHNVTALGGQCHAIGIVGQDEYANKLTRLLDKHHITHSLVVDPSRPTTVKTRILSQTHSQMQQLLRLDRISRDTIDGAIEDSLISKLESVSKQYSVLILSDYRAGLITDRIIQACKRIAAKEELTLIVDCQDQFGRFQNVSLLTPNQPDTEKAVGFEIKNETDLLQAGEDMLLLTGAQAVLVTRGKDGMSLFMRGSSPFHLPAFNRREVFDVSGAGDTVVATIALAVATGATLPEAITLGNIAASIVVTKSGTAVTTRKEMLDLLPSLKLS